MKEEMNDKTFMLLITSIVMGIFATIITIAVVLDYQVDMKKLQIEEQKVENNKLKRDY